MPEPWTCACGHHNMAGALHCGACRMLLGEVRAVEAGRLASSPEGVPRHKWTGTVDPDTDPTCLGTRAYLDGIVSGLSRPERRSYYAWLAGEVKRRSDDNDDLMAEMEGD